MRSIGLFALVALASTAAQAQTLQSSDCAVVRESHKTQCHATAGIATACSSWQSQYLDLSPSCDTVFDAAQFDLANDQTLPIQIGTAISSFATQVTGIFDVVCVAAPNLCTNLAGLRATISGLQSTTPFVFDPATVSTEISSTVWPTDQDIVVEIPAIVSQANAALAALPAEEQGGLQSAITALNAWRDANAAQTRSVEKSVARHLLASTQPFSLIQELVNSMQAAQLLNNGNQDGSTSDCSLEKLCSDPAFEDWCNRRPQNLDGVC